VEREDASLLSYRLECDDNLQTASYPFEIDFTVRYGLQKDGSVLVEFSAKGRGEPAPFAFGIHPYFSLSDRSNAHVRVPSSTTLDLDATLGIPLDPAASLSCSDYSRGIDLSLDEGIDQVLAGLTDRECRLLDKGSSDIITIHASEAFTHCVLYNDGENPFLCVEPWTPGLGGFAYMHDPALDAAGQMPRVARNEEIAGRILLKATRQN